MGKLNKTEKELTEAELKDLLKEQQKEKKAVIKKIENFGTDGKINPEFKKIKGLPLVLTRKLPFFKQKRFAKEINWRKELEKELDKETPDKKRLQQINKKLKEEKETENLPIKSPYLELIRADGSKEWFEGVKAGMLEITGTDEKTRYIYLDKGKLITEEIKNANGRTVQGWVAYENDHATYPHNIFMDSKAVFQNYEEVMKNRKDVEAERINARSNMLYIIAGAIILLFILAFIAVPAITGQTIGEMLPQSNAEKEQQTYCKICTSDLGALTPEEIQIIKQFRIDTQPKDTNTQ